MNLGTRDEIRAGAHRFQTWLDEHFDRPTHEPEHQHDDEPPLPQTQLRLFNHPTAA